MAVHNRTSLWDFFNLKNSRDKTLIYRVCLLNITLVKWAHSSAGRALRWQCRGLRFDPAWVHHFSVKYFS